jgi:hypothetical protein
MWIPTLLLESLVTRVCLILSAVELLDHCYRHDRDLTQQLLTVELSAFSRMTCLSLAYISGHYEFLAHPCPQMLLADLWLGGLRMRKSTHVKVITSFSRISNEALMFFISPMGNKTFTINLNL